MKTHTIELLENNALFSEQMTDFEFNIWIYNHTEIMNKKSLIGL